MKPKIPKLHPKLMAPELAHLAAQPDMSVRAAVAGHPNTPVYVLGRLAADFPAEVLSNPALFLLRLGQPQFMRFWSAKALLSLLAQPKSPTWLRQAALEAKQVEVQVALASHPDLSVSEARALAAHPAWLVRARIAARTDLSADLLDLLTKDPDYGVRLTLAYRSDLPYASSKLLSHDPSRFVQQALRQIALQRTQHSS